MRWLAVFLALTLGACATADGPSQEELKERWEQQNILPAGYKADLLAFMRTYLNDPANVRSAGVTAPQRKIVGPGERFVVCVRYDAKKDGGQYAGAKESMVVFVSGKLDRFVEAIRENRDLCKGAVYAPFPELQKLAR